MERKELRATNPSGNPDYQYYLKAEADEVMDAMDAEIAKLKARIKELEEKNRGVINKWTKSLKIIGAVKEALEQPEGHR